MKRVLATALFSILCFSGLARAGNINSTEVNKTAAALAFTQDIDLTRFKGVSVQGIYADGTPAAHTMSDGVKGTATLTILSTTSLLGKTIQVNTNTTLTFGTEIATGPVTGNTTVIIATTVAAALRASAAGTAISFSTGVVAGNSVVTATETIPSGYAPYLSASSTNTVWDSPYLANGVASAINPTTDVITKTSHGLTTGLKVWVSTTAGTMPGGLTFGTTYFAIYLTPDTYALATTANNAVAGTKIDITNVTGSGTIKTNPIALVTAAGNGFKWQASNDGTNYFDTSLSSITYSASGNTMWDLGLPNYRFLRMNFTPPTSGGLLIQAVVNGKD